MTGLDPEACRTFAVGVVTKLREAGYEALWAGGCVRDALMGRTPKDYDVATSATPEQIRDLFGRRRTLAIGAAFGVICVLGRKKKEGQIEVATFRQDATYSDGRHPDSVTFSTAREDAQRRDFTINGLFFDPLSEEVIDYVGGQEDLRRQVIRAIGDPHQRIAEDKLRLLRAVRFAATFDFQLDPLTERAVGQHAGSIIQVSAERIADEMRRMLTHQHRDHALKLLRDTRLLRELLPRVDGVFGFPGATDDDEASRRWLQTLAILNELERPDFPMSLAVVLRPFIRQGEDPQGFADLIAARWKLSGEERSLTGRCLVNEPLLRGARNAPWPRLQRVLATEGAQSLVGYAQAVARVLGGEQDVAFCQDKLQLPRAELDPPSLISGDDLKSIGLTPGPHFRTILEKVRDAQLEQQVTSRTAALDLARQLGDEPS